MSTVLACASCVASAFGDRTYNWPYFTLLAMPFLLAVAIVGVLAYSAGVRPRAALRALRRLIGRTLRARFSSHFTARLGRRTALARTATDKEMP